MGNFSYHIELYSVVIAVLLAAVLVSTLFDYFLYENPGKRWHYYYYCIVIGSINNPLPTHLQGNYLR